MPPYAYVACHADDALTIIDIGNPAAPVFTGSIQGAGAPNWLDDARSIFVRGIYAYIASSGIADALTIFNIANPAAPTAVGNFISPRLQGARGAFILENYAYVCEHDLDGLSIIDISNPSVPVRTGRITGAGAPPGGNWLDAPTQVFVLGSYAYVAAYNDYALTIIDVSNPAAPTFVGSIQGSIAGPPNWLRNITGVHVVGNYAYVSAALDFGSGALTIIDVSNPAAPTFAGSIQGGLGAPNWLRAAGAVFVRGNYAYVAASGCAALTIIDISNPLIPVFTGSIQGAGGPNFLGGVSSVHVVGNYAYVASPADNSLTIIDITNPAAPILAGSIQGAGAPPGGNWLGGARDVTAYNYPTVQTDPATGIIHNSAQLNGTLVDDGGLACDCGFEWGPTIAYGYTTGIQSRMSGQTFSQVLLGLNPGQTYHYRAFATNGIGTSHGADGTFVTPAVILPTVTTDPATGRGAIAATVNGTLNQDGGEACECGFEWGLDIGYGTTTPPQSKTTGETFSQIIGGLFPSTTYHFRAFATNSAGTSYGADRTFATALVINKAYALAREEL